MIYTVLIYSITLFGTFIIINSIWNNCREFCSFYNDAKKKCHCNPKVESKGGLIADSKGGTNADSKVENVENKKLRNGKKIN